MPMKYLDNYFKRKLTICYNGTLILNSLWHDKETNKIDIKFSKTLISIYV